MNEVTRASAPVRLPSLPPPQALYEALLDCVAELVTSTDQSRFAAVCALYHDLRKSCFSQLISYCASPEQVLEHKAMAIGLRSVSWVGPLRAAQSAVSQRRFILAVKADMPQCTLRIASYSIQKVLQWKKFVIG